MRVNARDAIISFEGFNFGSVENTVEVTIGGRPCVAVEGAARSELWKTSQDTPYIECQVGGLVVGRHAIKITVANQTITIPAAESSLFAECPRGFFGTRLGVHDCLECPSCTTQSCRDLNAINDQASVCDGGITAPYSSERFWLYNATDVVNATSTRGYSLDICLPAPAGINPCRRNNTCNEGYVNENACSVCKLGF